MKRLFLAAILAATSLASANAATVTLRNTDNDGQAVIELTGQIVPGDVNRIYQRLKQAQARHRRVSGIRLNSLGGDVREALMIGAGIRAIHIDTVVGKDAYCASACFIVFAAGEHKWASMTSHVAVHSASSKAGEDADARSATLLISRQLAEWGVPSSIIVKMLTTKPDDITGLGREDADAMEVTLFS